MGAQTIDPGDSQSFTCRGFSKDERLAVVIVRVPDKGLWGHWGQFTHGAIAITHRVHCFGMSLLFYMVTGSHMHPMISFLS